jgi:hypothetical protein
MTSTPASRGDALATGDKALRSAEVWRNTEGPWAANAALNAEVTDPEASNGPVLAISRSISLSDDDGFWAFYWNGGIPRSVMAFRLWVALGVVTPGAVVGRRIVAGVVDRQI